MFQLEPYKNLRSRHDCPSCHNSRVFVRYINTETGEYLDESVGRCNRESKCGYHYKPKEYFLNNPTSDKKPKRPTKSAPIIRRETPPSPEPPRAFYHSLDTLNDSLQNTANPFYQFLVELFPDGFAQVEKICTDYYLGFYNNLTCFWQIDRRGRILRGKLMKYNPLTGKRLSVFSFSDDKGKDVQIGTYWVHKVMQKKKEMPENVNLESCFFGEHLLRDDSRRRQTVCIVEAEKTALICAICRPEFLWLAAGAQRHLSIEKMRVLHNRNVILYPDADAFSIWKEKEEEAACSLGLNIKTSRVLEDNATLEEKTNGFDLADYIIREQRQINEYNFFVDNFNAKIDRIKSDQDLSEQFDFALTERAALMGLTPPELPVETVRAIVEYF